MRNLLTIIVLLFIFSACAAQPLQPEIQTQPEDTAYQPAPSTDNTNVSSTQVPGSPDQEYTSGELWLRLTSPKDGETVTRDVIDVNGQAPEGTVISLNEEILVVGGDGQFTIPIKLDEGPNVIELVASDLNGEEIALVLTVVFEKE